jgi:DNA (cytosine-5)-methyltransferase 1
MSPRSIPPASARLLSLRTRLGLSRVELADRLGKDVKTVARWEAGSIEPDDVVTQLIELWVSAGGAPRRSDFTFIDLFAGIGGMRLGFESAGGRCVFTSEWDKYAQRTYVRNFGHDYVHGDITKVPIDDIPDHDVLVAGFPCQPFSIAGVSKKNSLGRKHGFECETQGTLFFEIERILHARRPKAFLLENVKNLKGHDKGRTFATIMRVLQKDLGYNVTVRVIDASAFVPQHRERIFIVGFRDDVGFELAAVPLPPLASRPSLRGILHTPGGEAPEAPYTDARGRVNPKYVLTDHLWEYLQAYAAKHQAAGNGFGFGLVGPADISRTLSARYYKDGSEILIKRRGGNPRRLTPRECARLMGFDFGDRRWNIVVSDTQAYKQFGNAVVPPVVEAIARAMRPHLLGERDIPLLPSLPIAS